MTFGNGDGDAPNKKSQSSTANTSKIRWNSLAMELRLPGSCHCIRFGNEMAWSQSCRAFQDNVVHSCTRLFFRGHACWVCRRHQQARGFSPNQGLTFTFIPSPRVVPCTGRVPHVDVNSRLCVSPQPRTRRCRQVAPPSGSSGG
mgnify:CR=1 FL=1